MASNKAERRAELEGAAAVLREIVGILEKMAESEGIGPEHKVHSQLAGARADLAGVQARLAKLDRHKAFALH